MSKRQYGLHIGLALIAGLIGGIISSQFFIGEPVFAKKRVIKAQEFQVVDNKGKIRAKLGLTFKGDSYLQYFDMNSKGRIILGLDKDGNPGLVYVDKNNNERSSLFLGKEGTPYLYFCDKDGKRRSILHVDESGSSSLLFTDNKGQPRLALGSATTKTIKSGAIITRSPASLVLIDEDGKVFWSTP